MTFMTLSAAAEQISIVTEHLPPYSYLEEGQARGLSTEVVQAVLEETGHTSDIQFMPWARAYQTALTKPNTLVYSIARTPKREDLFAWIGTIAPFGAALYQRADAPPMELHSLSDARFLYVGVYRGDAKEAALIEHGFENLQTTDDDRLNLRKLMLGRLDMIAIDDSVIGPLLKDEGIDPKQLKKVMPIKELSGQLYMAFNKASDPELVKTFKEGLVTIKENGLFDQILMRYLLVN
ncbi:transporter substrate-binding domain-containing protein [Labrenzia sp. PHM005]|nr:transporter substrate-binding domain-containing protein [Labrenzia sp. PHM005]